MEQIDIQEKEKTEQKTGLNKEKIQQLISDPINGYYAEFNSSIDDKLAAIEDKITAENKEQVEKTELLKLKIKQIKSEVSSRYKSDGILGKKVGNIFIIIACFIIIGFALLPIYFKNKKVIEDYNIFAANNQKIIDETNEEKARIIFKVMEKVTPYKFAQEIFWANGLELCPTPNLAVIETMRLPTHKQGQIVGFSNCLNVRFKSTDCFLANYKEFWIDTVRTSASIVVTIRDEDRVENHTLVATHDEPTPRIDVRNWYVQKTNFKPEFSFTTHAQTIKKRDKSLFSNHEFSMRYGIGGGKHSLDIEQSLYEYFTPLAQEQYLDWASVSADNTIYKKGDHLLTPANDTADLAYYFTKHPPYRFSSLLKTEHNDTLADNIKLALAKTKLLTSEFIRNFVYINLSPVISREWYHNDNKYRIGSNYIFEEYNQPTNYISNTLAEKFTNLELLSLENPSDVDFYFVHENKRTNFGVNVFDLKLVTYITHKRIDPVTVYFRGRSYVINVPYVEYEEKPISMRLYAVLEQKPKEASTFFTWSRYLDNSILAQEPELIEELTAYLNEDEKPKKEVLHQHIKQLHSIMNNAHISFDDFNFISDDDGYFLLINNDDNKLKDDLEHEICSWMRKASF
ncbi:hypothetical protein JM47_03445 [Ureaplasma diversum]|uniref:Uncharacterized protein n=1 Tax=Ureaplasma diversum TaxID=42094 RepID=A0A0C5RMC9_9BACT|nr:hypothetical protein [Ureaplasma diversum]AJQ45582.1 hypothetical protein JM47_03445 [Ureaplasma diversum]